MVRHRTDHLAYEPDDEIAAVVKAAGAKTPLEKIVRTDWALTAATFGMGTPRRMVVLECLHVAVAHGQIGKMRCLRCMEMLKAGGDYVKFRYLDRGLQDPGETASVIEDES
jgi:hypothetical protein